MSAIRSMRRCALAAAIALPGIAFAGGPMNTCSGTAIRYANPTVTLNYDQGVLGSRTKAASDALVTNAVSLWTNVPTATVTLAVGTPLPVDVTPSNFATYDMFFGGTYTFNGNPVIYDSDGSILDTFYGAGASNNILGFAGSGGSCSGYTRGEAVLNGKTALNTGGGGTFTLTDATMTTTIAHEVGHLIGLDHTQLNNTQGGIASSGNYPLMYPFASRNAGTLHEDDVAAITAIYPDTNVNTTYGQITGNFTTIGGTRINGANIFGTGTGGAFSVVSDFLGQNNGYFRLYVPPGTYTLRAGVIDTGFTGGSSVGPYSEDWNQPSFQQPLYSTGGSEPSTANPGAPTVTPSGPMAIVTHPQTITITAGCVATVTFTNSGTGTVGGNCSLATPSISLGSSLNPAPAGQAVTFTAMVSGSSGTPTGTIIFRDNGVAISGCGGLAMVNGIATCSPMLGAGTHPITAVYSGNSTYGGITSSTLPQVMNGATATVSLGSSQNPAPIGSTVTYTVTVSGASGTPTGTVNFLDGASIVQGCSAVALNGGTATCPTSPSLGTHSMSAVYSGNSTYNAGTSSTLVQTVADPGTPSITLGSTANPSTVGQYVSYTAVVSGTFGTPTGTIVFRDNGTVINGCGGLVMTNGRASCTIGNQALGTHAMTAVYSGGGVYGGITSSTLPQVVNAAKANTPSITLGSSVNPSTVGQYVELTAVISGGAGTPTGTLVFLDNGDAISGCGGLTMTGGQATCTPGSLTQGTHSITTVYSGNGTYNGVTSSTLPQTVNPAKANTASFTLATSLNPTPAGQPVTFTAILSGGAGTPTGNVVFRDNGVTISGCGGLALVNGRVSCAPRLNPAGMHLITGIYLGDANYNGVTSSTVPETVQ